MRFTTFTHVGMRIVIRTGLLQVQPRSTDRFTSCWHMFVMFVMNRLNTAMPKLHTARLISLHSIIVNIVTRVLFGSRISRSMCGCILSKCTSVVFVLSIFTHSSMLRCTSANTANHVLCAKRVVRHFGFINKSSTIVPKQVASSCFFAASDLLLHRCLVFIVFDVFY